MRAVLMVIGLIAFAKPAVAAPADTLQHAVVEEAPPRRPLDLIAVVPEGWTVTLYFRVSGDARYTVVPMKPRSTHLVGRIPAARMRGPAVHYYLEARDRRGAVMAGAGKATTPNVVVIDRAAAPHVDD